MQNERMGKKQIHLQEQEILANRRSKNKDK